MDSKKNVNLLFNVDLIKLFKENEVTQLQIQKLMYLVKNLFRRYLYLFQFSFYKNNQLYCFSGCFLYIRNYFQ
mgnify:CR=1 FL=1